MGRVKGRKPGRAAAPARKLSPMEQGQVERAAKHKQAWARRHPRAAAAERGFRKQRALVHEAFDNKHHGTPETHAEALRRREGALARLYQTGGIDSDQLLAAFEIAEVAERLQADVAVRTASLEARVDATRMGDGSFYEALGAVRREVAYTSWRAALKGPIAPVLEMIVGDYVAGGPIGYTIVAKRYRMGNRRALGLLIGALDLWDEMLGRAYREVDGATLAAAQAGILA